ncbi:MAG: branched-chain amino acid ABC transporter permease [Acidimicrobiales bacterium]
MAVDVQTPPPLVTEGDDELLPARPVDLRRAVRLGVISGVTVAFVSAIGMVENFSERNVLDDMSLGTALLVGIPFVFGFFAGRPPAQLAGLAPTRPSWRNPVAGLLAGLLSATVLALFVALIVNFDIREYFINISPALAEDVNGPRLLIFGRSMGLGIALVFAVDSIVAAVAGSFHLLGTQWRRAMIAGVLTVVGFAMLEPFVGQVLRGIEEEWNILTEPLVDFLYDGGALTIPAAVVVALAGMAGNRYSRRPGRRPLKARVERLPHRQRRAAMLGVMAVGLIVVAVLPPVLGVFLSEVLGFAGIFVLMALGLNIVVGYSGLLDLGYVAFFAVGAYTTAIITAPGQGLEWGAVFWVAVPFVLLAAALAGILVGTPVLRMRGDYLAIVTLGFGEIARLLFLSDWLAPTFGGAQGIRRIPNISLFGYEIQGPERFLYAVFVLIVVAAYVSYALQNSRIGRAWMAMREDESVAEAVGVNIVAAKLSAFVIGALLAGLGGALFATKVGSVFPSSFDIIVSITVLVVVIVGGMASVPGVILGAVVLVGLPQLLREFEEYRFLIYGALLIFMMLARPEGFIPSKRRAQELHEADVSQDAWLRAQAAAGTANGG